MRLLVCGGRNFADVNAIEAALETIHEKTPITLLIHGGARGADKLASEWAKRNNVEVKEFPANWERFGPSAGPIRNKQMLVEGKPDVVVAMPGGPGTTDMVKQARAHGVKVIVPGVGLDLSHVVIRLLSGLDLSEAQSVLGRCLIHLCLINGWTKATMLDAISDQWDMMDKTYRKRRH
jgi:hypothetical protein